MVVVAIAMAPSMALMHEDVHERTEQKNKKRQCTKQMSLMLGPEKEPGNTTPEAPMVQHIAREMVDAGATHMILEASSHGLVLHRLDGCDFDVVAFTNLTQDHLDFHKDMDDYLSAKLKAFDYLSESTKPDKRSVVWSGVAVPA